MRVQSGRQWCIGSRVGSGITQCILNAIISKTGQQTSTIQINPNPKLFIILMFIEYQIVKSIYAKGIYFFVSDSLFLDVQWRLDVAEEKE